MVAVSVSEPIHDVLEREGTIRLSELAEERDCERRDLYHPIMELVEQGDVAIFPVGDVVELRYES